VEIPFKSKQWAAWKMWIESQTRNCMILNRHLHCAEGDAVEIHSFCQPTCVRVPRAHPLSGILQLLNDTFRELDREIKPAYQGTDMGKRSNMKKTCKQRGIVNTKNFPCLVANCCHLLHALEFIEAAMNKNPDAWGALQRILELVHQVLEERSKSSGSAI